MSQVFTDRVRVRAYECDSLGHVNNAVYIQYLQQATLDVHGTAVSGDAFWNPRALAIEYHTPARYGDELNVATWVVDADNWRVVRGYRITRDADAAPVVYARIQWEYCDSATQGPRRLPEEDRLEQASHVPAPLKAFNPPPDNGARPFYWRHQVRRYELDATNRVGAAVYFNWLEEVTYRAADIVGWSIEKLREANFLTLQRRHDAEFFDAALNGDDIEIISRLIEMRRVRGTWVHEIYRMATNTLLMRDYSTGVFLDWAGNIRSAPAEMISLLLQGEPVQRRA